MTSSLEWKAWLLRSFEHCEGGLLRVNDIISDAEQVKEKFARPPNSKLFGHLIKQIWGCRVKLVKRGSHKQRRVNYYENLQRKSPCNTSLVDLRSQIQQISSLKGWHLLDQGEDLSFIRHESWSFKNQRVITEIKVRDENGFNSISLQAHGCQTYITDFFKFDCPENQQGRIELVLSTVNSYPLCRGITVTNEALHTTLPYESGNYSADLTSSANNSDRRAFSAKCLIICSLGDSCTNCKKLQYSVRQCKKRKLENNGIVSPFTNKRFLSKAEVSKQLQKERQAGLNAEKREKYWREKFEAECLEMDDEDHTVDDRILRVTESTEVDGHIRIRISRGTT